jgi:hypothetical protein
VFGALDLGLDPDRVDREASWMTFRLVLTDKPLGCAVDAALFEPAHRRADRGHQTVDHIELDRPLNIVGSGTGVAVHKAEGCGAVAGRKIPERPYV